MKQKFALQIWYIKQHYIIYIQSYKKISVFFDCTLKLIVLNGSSIIWNAVMTLQALKIGVFKNYRQLI